MQLLVRLLVGKLYPYFCFVWYDLPTNSPTNDPTNSRINWIWMSKKIGLYNQRVIHRSPTPYHLLFGLSIDIAHQIRLIHDMSPPLKVACAQKINCLLYAWSMLTVFCCYQIWYHSVIGYIKTSIHFDFKPKQCKALSFYKLIAN